MVMTPDLHVVILAGGRGTRFWPASRAHLPKQFLPVGGDRPLLRTTFERVLGLVDADHVWIVTGQGMVDQSREVCPEIPPDQVLGEPVGRNTLPAIAWVSQVLRERAPGSVQAVLPADHVVAPVEAFQELLRAAAELALREEGALVTLGIRPTHPATGFGWIEVGEALAEARGQVPHRVARFVEKPPRELAEEYLSGGKHLWNSGMFIWSTAAVHAALSEHAPATMAALASSDPVETLYGDLEAISIDHGLLERSDRVFVFPADLSWSDVGSWDSLKEVLPSSPEGNLVDGGAHLIAEESNGCVVHGPPGTLTALLGVDDLVVVRSGNAVLVMPRDRDQEVRRVVERVERDHPEFS